MNTTTNFGVFFVILLHSDFKNPDFNAIPNEMAAIRSEPKGINSTRFV